MSKESYQEWRAELAQPPYDDCAVRSQDDKMALVFGSVAFGMLVAMIVTLLIISKGESS